VLLLNVGTKPVDSQWCTISFVARSATWLHIAEPNVSFSTYLIPGLIQPTQTLRPVYWSLVVDPSHDIQPTFADAYATTGKAYHNLTPN